MGTFFALNFQIIANPKICFRLDQSVAEPFCGAQTVFFSKDNRKTGLLLDSFTVCLKRSVNPYEEYELLVYIKYFGD